MKTIVKKYAGYTLTFKPEIGRGYKVSANGFSPVWYQYTTSVREANKRISNF